MFIFYDVVMTNCIRSARKQIFLLGTNDFFSIHIFMEISDNVSRDHCSKSDQIQNFTGPYFSVFGLNVRIRKNSVFGHFSRIGIFRA